MFDSEKSQAQDYVRVRVLLDVRNPLRNSNEIQLPNGDMVLISFDYERIRKRCFQCQRLTHEKNICPFKQPGEVKASYHISENSSKQKELLIQETEQPISNQVPPKLLADAMKEISNHNKSSLLEKINDKVFSGFSDIDFSGGFKSGVSAASSSGLSVKQKNPRKRNSSGIRKFKAKTDVSEEEKVSNVDN